MGALLNARELCRSSAFRAACASVALGCAAGLTVALAGRSHDSITGLAGLVGAIVGGAAFYLFGTTQDDPARETPVTPGGLAVYPPVDTKAAATHQARAERLRVQGIQLLDNGFNAEALRHFDEYLVQGDHLLQATLVHAMRGRALARLGRPDEALEAYRQAIRIQRRRPQVAAYAALEFAELVVSLRRHSAFGEALHALDEFEDGSPFPVIRHRVAVARARMAHQSGDQHAAQHAALQALEAAATTKPPFARHPDIGLVPSLDPQLEAELRALIHTQQQR